MQQPFLFFITHCITMTFCVLALVLQLQLPEPKHFSVSKLPQFFLLSLG